MNIFAPTKLELLSESSEGNCAEHYAYRRACDSAYWAAIYLSYRMFQKGNVKSAFAWSTYIEEVSKFPQYCH